MSLKPGINSADLRRVCDRAGVAPFYAGRNDGLILSALDGCMGEAYLNDGATAALIVNGDFAFPAGDAGCPEADALLKLAENGRPGRELIVDPGTDVWAEAVRRAWGGRASPGERYALRRDQNRFDPQKLTAMRDALPSGVRLAPIDGALYRAALGQAWSRDFVSLFDSRADYLARGRGVMALAGGEPVAGASSYAVYRGGIEIEVDTREDWRRQGLAAACAAALMLGCLADGLFPGWDAANRASLALAEKLGYVFDRAYPVWFVDLSD
jgi:hypothetical protein